MSTHIQSREVRKVPEKKASLGRVLREPPPALSWQSLSEYMYVTLLLDCHLHVEPITAHSH